MADNISMSKEDLAALVAEQVAEQVAKEKAAIAEQQARVEREAKLKAMTPEEAARKQRTEGVTTQAVDYGNKVLAVLLDSEDGFPITDDGLRQLCWGACSSAARGHHWARSRAIYVKSQLDNAHDEGGIGLRRWNIESKSSSATGTVDPRRPDANPTEFVPAEKRLEEDLKFYQDRMDQLEVLGTMFEYIDDYCLNEKLRKDEAARQEGKNVPEANTGYRVTFDVSDQAFAKWEAQQNNRRQTQNAERAKANRAAFNLNFQTRPLGEGTASDESQDVVKPAHTEHLFNAPVDK